MNDLTAEIESLNQWKGHEERVEEILSPLKVEGYHAVLDTGEPSANEGEPAPPGIHWMLARSNTPHSQLGHDGHGRRGGFIPPINLPRRMWAGSDIEFIRPLVVGEKVVRRSNFDSVVHKQGRTGNLVFVKLRHEYSIREEICLCEIQTLVFRESPKADDPKPELQPSPGEASWERSLVPDPVLLFRYSALTFNGHRIHYDRSYCIEEEGYPGLLVHGPLQATLLLDLCRRYKQAAPLKRFMFRAMSPVFDGEEIGICGIEDEGKGRLWIRGPAGEMAMSAEASW